MYERFRSRLSADKTPLIRDDNAEVDSGERLGREVAEWRKATEQALMDREFDTRIHRAVESLRSDYKNLFVLA